MRIHEGTDRELFAARPWNYTTHKSSLDDPFRVTLKRARRYSDHRTSNSIIDCIIDQLSWPDTISVLAKVRRLTCTSCLAARE